MLSATYIYAPIFLAILFLLCLLVVVGFKAIFSSFFSFSKKNSSPASIDTPNFTEKPVRRKKIRTIEINPDDVDRIYVRKG